MIAESNPALMHSSKNIEFRLILDNGERPKLMFDIPSMMWISGKFSRIFNIALIVSLAFNLSSSIPVDIGRANEVRQLNCHCKLSYPVMTKKSNRHIAII